MRWNFGQKFVSSKLNFELIIADTRLNYKPIVDL